MSREQQIRDADEQERRSLRVRARFGISSDSRADDVRDWLMSPTGAVVTLLAVVLLVAYLVVELLAGFSGP